MVNDSFLFNHCNFPEGERWGKEVFINIFINLHGLIITFNKLYQGISTNVTSNVYCFYAVVNWSSERYYHIVFIYQIENISKCER